uniref:PHD-type domain-containing protein n=1 Tax=Bursaphelenchus xylophilus TaxID=6326 RepID=A0A1I7RNF0_BURXY
MDQERASYIRGAIQRGPGKRQIKPTAAALADIHVEDESDEDFNPEESGSEQESDEGDGEDDDAEDMDEEDDEEDEEEEEESEKESEFICTICLNLRKSEGDKVIQCDKCGVAVHESCYAVDDYIDDDVSIVSNFSTEPWFCEPCLYGYTEPPHCELCPRRFGAFKRADVGGKFVHLVCALYTAGVSFGDVDNLTAVSWQEIDYRRFGRKSCNACTSMLEARTGIVTCCEAGLCKQHYHITCAQKMGFLMDADFEHSHQPSSSSESHMEPHPHFILCKTHNASEVVQKKRFQYLKMIKQEEKRMARLKFKKLNNREENKLRSQRKHYETRMENFRNVTVHMPSIENKRQRLMHTNAGILEGFAEKAELLGLSKKDFEESFTRLDPSEITQMAPAFSHDFIRYYNNREVNVFNEELERLEDNKREFVMLEREEKDLQKILEDAKERKRSGKEKQHEEEVNSLFKRYLAFFKKMPIRFDRSTEPGKKEKSEREAAKNPPRKKPKMAASDPYKADSRPQSSSANSLTPSDLSTPPPLTSVSDSRSASEGMGDHYLDERPVLIPMIAQNGEMPKKSRSQRSKRVLKV